MTLIASTYLLGELTHSLEEATPGGRTLAGLSPVVKLVVPKNWTLCLCISAGKRDKIVPGKVGTPAYVQVRR